LGANAGRKSINLTGDQSTTLPPSNQPNVAPTLDETNSFTVNDT
jgi:hypothetical protein